jgi:capsular polysaccharide biosynthesis protein
MRAFSSTLVSNGARRPKQIATLGLIGLAITGAMYLLGLYPRAKQDGFSATAMVLVPQSGFGSASAQEEIVPDALIREAVATGSRAKPPGVAAIANIRRNLRVSTREAATGWTQVEVTYTATTPEEAIHVVNHLAKVLAQRHQSPEAESSCGAHLRARAAADRARSELRRAESDLRQFARQQFEQSRQRSLKLEKAVVLLSPAKPAARPEPVDPKIENPAWAELNEQVTKLKDERAKLLTTRTAEHPAVKDVDADLARLETILAGIPRYLVKQSERAEATPAADRDLVPNAGPKFRDESQAMLEEIRALARFNAGAMEDYAARSALVDEAWEKYEQAAAVERQTVRENPGISSAKLRLATQCRSTTSLANRRWLLVALGAGLALTLGAGLTWARTAGGATLSSAADVEAALAVPVVGTVSVGIVQKPRNADSSRADFLAK